MLLRLLISLTVLLGLVGCQSTTVHLYGRYLSKEQTNTTVSLLESQGFEVEVNNLAFPHDVQENAIVYSPFQDDRQSVNTLSSTLEGVSWPIDSIRPLSTGNHWFSKDSIGLFLLPKGVSPGLTLNDLIGEYESFACDRPLKIVIKQGGKYSLHSTVSDQDESGFFEGQWRAKNLPMVSLTSQDVDWPMYVEASIKAEKDDVGVRESIVLQVMTNYKLLPECKFIKGTFV